MSLRTPLAFFIFNRPDQTARVFAEIARARPQTLLVIADGPRADSERDACEAARAITERIDWTCDVRRNYSPINLGCRRRMYTGIDWVFTQFEEAILLEDDCLPEPTFFRFCGELLNRYRNDPRIMMISGDNMQRGRRWTPYSYYFSVITHIWGWATWRRAWRLHDPQLADWPQQSASELGLGFVRCEAARRFYRGLIEQVHAGKLDTWDVGWMYTAWKNRGLTILPETNLISNIGYGAGATHTRKRDIFAELPTSPMEFPLLHPPRIEANHEADGAFFDAAIKAA